VRQGFPETAVESVGGGGWLCSSPEANQVAGVRVLVMSSEMPVRTWSEMKGKGV